MRASGSLDVAWLTNFCSSTDLPMPAAPSITTAEERPSARPANACASSTCSSSRPTSTVAEVGNTTCLSVLPCSSKMSKVSEIPFMAIGGTGLTRISRLISAATRDEMRIWPGEQALMSRAETLTSLPIALYVRRRSLP